MRKFLNRILSALAISLAIPTFLMLASWNSLPGERLYSVKRGMEDVVFLLAGKSFWGRYLSVRYTERRYDEAQKLLAEKLSPLGFAILVTQAKKSKDLVIESNDGENGRQLITDVKRYRIEVRNKKEEIQKVVEELDSAERELGSVQVDLENKFSPLPPTP